MAVYTTSAAIAKLLSSDGLALRIDDDATGDDDAITEASLMVDEYLLPCYAEADLPGNAWVQYACRAIAAVYVCERRGNTAPPSTLARAERYTGTGRPGDPPGRLELVRIGQVNVPRLVRVRIDAPTLASPRVKLTPLGPRVVIDRSRGPVRNQPQDYRKNDERLDPLDFVI